jgi:hypothetical protein
MRSFALLCTLLGLGAGFVSGQQIFDVVRGLCVISPSKDPADDPYV